MSRVVIVGAGVGGLVCGLRCARAGHDVTVVEQGPAPGGKAGRVVLREGEDVWTFDSGPSLLTMPWVFRAVLPDLELVPVEPVTRYRFADGSDVELSADLARSRAALDAWSPGAGDDWARLLRVGTAMWRASEPILSGPPPLPPRRDGEPPDPRALLAVRPWHTVSSLARTLVGDPRLVTLVERFATYAGADPRRAPAALVLAGYVEHAFGAWHVPGGIYELVRQLAGACEEAGARLRFGTRAAGIVRDARGVTGVRVGGGEVLSADAVAWNGDALALERLVRGNARAAERSVSGLAVMLALRGRTPGLVHHEIRFPADYHAEHDDLFVARRPVRDPTLYVSTSCATTPREAPADGENWFVLANAPAGVEANWEDEADRIVERLGVRHRVAARHVRSPTDLEHETGAVGGAIYGAAPHGRLGTLKRPGPRVLGIRGLYRVGGTAHPGGGLPLVALSGDLVAREIGAAW